VGRKLARAQGYLVHEKTPVPLGPPQDPRSMPTGPKGRCFLLSKVPLNENPKDTLKHAASSTPLISEVPLEAVRNPPPTRTNLWP